MRLLLIGKSLISGLKEELSAKITDELNLIKLNVCDRTLFFLEGVISLTNNIPHFGYYRMISQLDDKLLLATVGIGLLVLLLIATTARALWFRLNHEPAIREQVLSIDTPQRLYSLPAFQAELNHLYYEWSTPITFPLPPLPISQLYNYLSADESMVLVDDCPADFQAVASFGHPSPLTPVPWSFLQSQW